MSESIVEINIVASSQNELNEKIVQMFHSIESAIGEDGSYWWHEKPVFYDDYRSIKGKLATQPEIIDEFWIQFGK